VDKSLQNVIKHDQFVETVGSATSFVSSHRKQVAIYIIAALVLAAAGYFGWSYFNEAKRERQIAFSAAVGVAADSTARNDEAVKKIREGFEGVIKKFPGSYEANMSSYLLAIVEMENGDATKAEQMLKDCLKLDRETATLAKFALAEYYAGLGKADEAEKLYREVIASPTGLLPKEQSTLQLARLLIKSKPEEARKLLEPLRSERSPISSPALELLGTLPAAPAEAKK
jgi:predicted negative regulator of RcsB-dependent stress response